MASNPGIIAAIRSKRPRRAAAKRAGERTLWVLAIWLPVVFLLGGGSRADVQSLMLLRPLTVVVLAYGLATLTSAQIRANRLILGLATACLALPLLQLAPLPPSIWSSLPGRAIVVEIDRQAALGAPWRSLSLAPAATWNAFWSLLTPASVLVLGIQLDREQRAWLAPVILIVGGLSALVGLLQLLSDPDGPLFLYRITNNGLPVGLFANRNHQAAFLATLLPLLFAWAWRRRDEHGDAVSRRWLGWGAAAAGAAFFVPLILVTGSRAGLLLALLALASLPVIAARTGGGRDARRHRHPARARFSRLPALLLVLGLAAIIIATVAVGRGPGFERLMATDPADELRAKVLPVAWAMVMEYFPWGSGLGTFDPVYRLHEPQQLLTGTYMNHVHDDWVELALTGGLPALAVLAIAAVAIAVRAVRLALLREGRGGSLLLPRAGVTVVLLLALASVSDYPLRVPSLACLAVLATLWTLAPGPIGGGEEPRAAGVDAKLASRHNARRHRRDGRAPE